MAEVDQWDEFSERLRDLETGEVAPDLISPYMMLGVTRAFWPMSAVAYTNPQGLDVSGNGNHLTNNNSADFGYDNLVPYVHFDGVNQNLTRADAGAGNWADIRGNEAYVVAADQGFTCYLWAYFDNAVGANEGMLVKGDGTVNTSYLLLRTAAGTLSFRVGTGAALLAVTSTVIPSAAVWTFVACRFVPSTTIDMWVSYDGALQAYSTAVPAVATLLDSAFTFALGSYSTNILYMTGRQSSVSLHAAAHTASQVEATLDRTRGAFGI